MTYVDGTALDGKKKAAMIDKMYPIVGHYSCSCIPHCRVLTLIVAVDTSKQMFIHRIAQPKRSNLCSPSFLHLGVDHAVVSRLWLLGELVHGRNWRHVLPHDVLANIPRQLLGVVLGVFPVADVEYGIQLLQSERLGFGQQEIAVHGSEQIPAGVPAEGASGSESRAQSGPAEGDDEVEAPAGGGRKGHTDVADVERESFGGVGEGDWAFRGRVDGHEAEYSSGDTAKLCRVRLIPRLRRSSSDQEAEAAPEKANGHERETAEEQVAASKGIDGVDRWDGE
jgi:hypothetical protein